MNQPAHNLSPDLRDLAARLLPVLRRYGVVRAGIFGSVARGEARPDSDLDLLVEFGRLPSLHDLVELHDDLEDLVGHKVDVVQYKLLREIIRDEVMSDHVAIL
ncbi:MAG: nucleotidyltransferase family protein [Desulfarculus sp.]|nr:nucleotidyltransferase family protein [Desulfarculus sp.]